MIGKWTGKRFVPFTDEVLWKGNQAEGVYDTLLNMRAISFAYFLGVRELKDVIAMRLNLEVPKDDKSPQTDLAQKIYDEVKK